MPLFHRFTGASAYEAKQVFSNLGRIHAVYLYVPSKITGAMLLASTVSSLEIRFSRRLEPKSLHPI
jgi:hypothetical protein